MQEDVRVLRNRQGNRSSQCPALVMGTVYELQTCKKKGFYHYMGHWDHHYWNSTGHSPAGTLKVKMKETNRRSPELKRTKIEPGQML